MQDFIINRVRMMGKGGSIRLDAKELDEYIGRKIKEYRNKKGLTQKELGQKLGIGHTTVSGYEKGTITLNSNTLFVIGEILDVKVDDLFPERKPDEAYLEKTKDMYTENLKAKDMYFLQKLTEKTAALNDEERKKFLESIQFTVDYYDKMNDDK
jgi:transcriptional regulator with XRE-family HTH domain